MTSVIRSDTSLSTRFFNGRAESAASAAHRLTDAKQVTQLSAVIGNGARDRALQINGHVAGKINNLNFKYLVVSCHCDIVRAVASTGVAPLLPTAVPVKPRLPAPVKRPTHFNTVGPAEIATIRKEKKNITVFSKATGQPATFCVIFPPSVEDNFISRKIVNRMGLGTHFDTAAVSSITWDSKCLSSAGAFVDLSFTMPRSTKSIARRFNVLEDCPFDMILGNSATASSLN